MKIELSKDEIAVLIKCIDSAIMSWIRYRFDLPGKKEMRKRRLEGISLNELKEKFCKAIMQEKEDEKPAGRVIK